MKPAPFAYHRPATIGETVALLAELAPLDGRILAGGQSLVPMMAFRLATPAHLIDINRTAGLDTLAVGDGRLRIGAQVRHAAFHAPLAAPVAAPVAEGPLGRLLAAAVRHLAHYPIRLRGTFCGSLAHADPAAEWCAVAATLDAEFVAVSQRGERLIPAADFFQGAMTTALRSDELLAEARLPLLPDDAHVGFAEFSRRPGDYALAMAVAVLRLEGGVVHEARIGLGGAEASPRRLAAAEAVLRGERLHEWLLRAAGAAAAGAIDPLEDPETDAVYRRELVAAMVCRALGMAASEALA
ncbi:MAG: FAD binding domain-containing protein [Thiohalocapsa sp.]